MQEVARRKLTKSKGVTIPGILMYIYQVSNAGDIYIYIYGSNNHSSGVFIVHAVVSFTIDHNEWLKNCYRLMHIIMHLVS